MSFSEISKQLQDWFKGLDRYIDRPWYFPLIMLLALLDLFVLFIPSDALVVTTSLLRPRKAALACLSVTIGSALGALILTWAIQSVGFHAAVEGSAAWSQIEPILQKWGGWGLAFVAVGPLPQQPAVAACALAQMPPLVVMGWIFVGRLPKYIAFAWIAAKAPALIKKIPGMG